MNRLVELPSLARPLDDTLFALAAGSQVNFFCDVTEVAEGMTVQSFPGTSLTKTAIERDPLKWKSNLWLQLGDVMEQSGMTHLHSAPDTILMWHPPESLQLSSEVIGDWKRRQRALFSPAMDTSEMRGAWRNYFGGLGWDGVATDVDFKVKLADLPLEARRRVLFEAWQKLFWDADWNCFDDRAWAQTKIRVDKSFSFGNEKAEPYFSVVKEHELASPMKVGDPGESEFHIAIGPVSATVAVDPTLAVTTSAELLIPSPLLTFDLTKASPRVQALDEAALRADLSLNNKVELESRRASLPELLQLLSQKSGVALRSGLVAGDALSARRLTIKTTTLSVCDTMLALSHLTGAVWTHDAQGYVLHDNHEDALNFHLRQIGDPSAYQIRQNAADKQKERFRSNAPLLGEVLKTIKLEELQKPEGVSITALPQTVQNQLRRVVEEEVARSLPVRALMARDFLSSAEDPNQLNDPDKSLFLQLREEKGSFDFKTVWSSAETSASYNLRSVHMLAGPDLTLTLRKSDGELVSSLFNSIRWIDLPAKGRWGQITAAR